ncbi:MAG: phosphatidate cytidylyltransferase [Chryseosolibacter sp.]
MRGFYKRVVTGIVIVGLSVGAVLLGPSFFFGFCLLVSVLGLWEFYRLFEVTRDRVRAIAGLLLSVSLLASVFLVTMLRTGPEILSMNLPVISFIFSTVLFTKTANPFSSLAYTFLGQAYITLPFALLFLTPFALNGEWYHQRIVLGYFFLLWSNDSGAYAFGSLFGKTPLAPVISPGKTWEGSAGGVLLTGVTVYILCRRFRDIESADWIVLGVIVVVLGTLGDLVKSVMKRNLHVKDSGTILPGHGGILDRFDSMIGSVPFVFLYLSLVSSG